MTEPTANPQAPNRDPNTPDQTAPRATDAQSTVRTGNPGNPAEGPALSGQQFGQGQYGSAQTAQGTAGPGQYGRDQGQYGNAQGQAMGASRDGEGNQASAFADPNLNPNSPRAIIAAAANKAANDHAGIHGMPPPAPVPMSAEMVTRHAMGDAIAREHEARERHAEANGHGDRRREEASRRHQERTGGVGGGGAGGAGNAGQSGYGQPGPQDRGRGPGADQAPYNPATNYGGAAGGGPSGPGGTWTGQQGQGQGQGQAQSAQSGPVAGQPAQAQYGQGQALAAAGMAAEGGGAGPAGSGLSQGQGVGQFAPGGDRQNQFLPGDPRGPGQPGDTSGMTTSGSAAGEGDDHELTALRAKIPTLTGTEKKDAEERLKTLEKDKKAKAKDDDKAKDDKDTKRTSGFFKKG